MSAATKAIEEHLAPHLDIHYPPTVEGLKKLVAAVRQEAIEQAINEAALVASKSYYMDENGSSPMSPEDIATRIREDAVIPFGLQRLADGSLVEIPQPEPTTTEAMLSEVDEALNNLLD